MKRTLLFLALVISACLCLQVAAQDRSENADRVLKSGDPVSVVLWRIEGTHRTGMIRGGPIVEGKLTVPLIGEVQAAGLTVEELKQVLQGRYAKRINERHEVSVTLGQTEGFKFAPAKAKGPKFIPLAQAITPHTGQP